MERFLESTFLETKHFIIEKKDGSKIGWIMHFNFLNTYINMLELAYGLLPSERGKGYSAEAAQLMVDYLFLSKDIVRIVASIHIKNVISRKIWKSLGLKKKDNAKVLLLQRRIDRHVHLQHSQRRMERTKNTTQTA